MSAMKMALIVGFALALLDPAQACRRPGTAFDPAQTRSDVIVAGHVIELQSGQFEGAEFTVEITSVISGQFAERVYNSGWLTGPGACAARGPHVKVGDEIVVYFANKEGYRSLQGWVLKSTLERPNPLGDLRLPALPSISPPPAASNARGRSR